MTFAPTLAVVSSDTIIINYNDGAAAQTSNRDVTGTGISPALLTLSESDPYDYGLIADGGNVTYTFTITNSGASSATGLTEVGLAAPFDFLGGGYPGTGGDCAGTLNAGATCNIEIQYGPGVVSAADNDTIDMQYNDGNVVQNATRDVTGVAVAPASITITEADPYDYGTLAVGSNLTHVFTLNNAGGFQASAIAEIGLAAPFAFSGGTFPGTAGTCGVTLAPAASCDIEVEYSPVATGVQTDTISIQYNNGATVVTSDRDVQGTGAAPAVITITETDPYDFGSVTQGASTNHIFTLNNTGAVPATLVAGAGLAVPFSFTGGSYPGTAGT